MKKQRYLLPLLTLLAVLLLFSSCGALRKTPPTIPVSQGWEGPSGQIGDLLIILEEEVVVLDLEDLDGILDAEYLAEAATH